MFGKIIGTGKYIPDLEISNKMLEEVIETDDKWIKDRTGIASRHIMAGETTAEMAARAAGDALEDAGLKPEEIDLIIVSTVSSNLILPNTACFVQREIGAVNASCFDVNSACTGFILAYNIAQNFINSDSITTALIIGAEGLSKLVNWRDRGSSILFGDGAGAAILKKDESACFKTLLLADGFKGNVLSCRENYSYRNIPFSENYKNKQFAENRASSILQSDQSKNAEESQETFIQMDGKEVFSFAVRRVPECIKKLMGELEMEEKDIDCFLLHQANRRILEAIAKRLGTSMDKVPVNIEKYGNTSSACIPILLDEVRRAGVVKEKSRIIMSGFGAGLTWGATYLEL